MYQELVSKFFEVLNRYFISDRLLQDTLRDSRQRALVLVGVLAISALSGSMMGLALGSLYLVTHNPLHLLATGIAVVTVATYMCTLWHFKRMQELLPAANLYGLATTFSTIAPCMITGGIADTPYLPLILVVPIFLFLIAGKRAGIQWSLAALACLLVLLAVESMGVKFPQVIPQSEMGLFRFMTWLTTLGLLVLGLVSYEGDFEALTRRILEERSLYAHQAMHDPLTGLSNRELFRTRAREAVEHALARRHKAAVIFVDLDDFKQINDGYGHETGDDVLNLVAQRLQANVRSADTVARLGGDEFAIVLHGIESVEIAEMIVEQLRVALQAPFEIGQHSVNATGSIGVAIAPDQGRDVDLLLRTADQAMYRAKEVRERRLPLAT